MHIALLTVEGEMAVDEVECKAGVGAVLEEDVSDGG